MGSLRYGRMATWPELVRLLRKHGLVGTLRMKRRFVRGTVLGRDASYEEALYERSRFVYPLVFEKLRTSFNAD